MYERLSKGWAVPPDVATNHTAAVLNGCGGNAEAADNNLAMRLAVGLVPDDEWAPLLDIGWCNRRLALYRDELNTLFIPASRKREDQCLSGLVAAGLWEPLVVAVLGSPAQIVVGMPVHAAPNYPGSSFWLKGLSKAGKKCGTWGAWHEDCSNTSHVQHDAYLAKLARDYVRLFLTDVAAAAAAAKTFNVTYACNSGMAAAYKSLAAVWIAYAGLLVVGLVGLAVYWCTCGHRRRLRGRPAAVALQRLLASLQSASVPGSGTPQHQRTSIVQKAWHLMRLALPRIHAVAFALDFGLDVYTLVQLWRYSRWFVQLLSAILLSYGVLALLVAPGLCGARSNFPHTLCGTCLCSCMCWPAVWWFDVRMLSSLIGVQLPHCGESTLAMAPYTDVRMLFEDVFEALPSALVSTAVLYDTFGVQSKVSGIPVALLWLNLFSSFSRGAVEIWKLAVLTHAQGNWCFITTIANMVWDMLPPGESTNTPTGQVPVHSSTRSQQKSGAPPAPSCSAAAVTVAPQPLVMLSSNAQHCQQQQQQQMPQRPPQPQQLQQPTQQQLTGLQDGKVAKDKHVVADGAAAAKITRESSDLQYGCGCFSCCEVEEPSQGNYHWVLTWVLFWVGSLSALVSLLCISIGCVDLLVQDGVTSLGLVTLPKYWFGGDATCGAGSLFGALHSGASASCTLPNLVAYSE